MRSAEFSAIWTSSRKAQPVRLGPWGVKPIGIGASRKEVTHV